MTGKERMLAALNRKQPDRIPTAELEVHPAVMRKITGTDDPVIFAYETDMDAIFVWPDRRMKWIDKDHFYDDFGVLRQHVPDEYPVPVDSPFKSPADVAKFKMPSADDPAIWRSTQEIYDRCGKEKLVVARVRDVLSFPRDGMGYMDFLISFVDEQEMLEELMDMSVEYTTQVVKNLKSIGIEAVAMCDDIADNTSPLMGPRAYKTIVLPYFKKLITNMHDIGVKVIKHSDGNLNPILPELIDSGIDCLHPIDKRGGMDMKAIKKKYGDRIAMMGNIDCVQTLTTGTIEQLEAEIEDTIAQGATNGGLILSSSNSIHAGVSPELYAHMLKYIRENTYYSK